jgi:hypothetical protein
MFLSPNVAPPNMHCEVKEVSCSQSSFNPNFEVDKDMEVLSFDTLKLLGWKEQIQNDPYDDGYNDISKERGPKI